MEELVWKGVGLKKHMLLQDRRTKQNKTESGLYVAHDLKIQEYLSSIFSSLKENVSENKNLAFRNLFGMF